MESYFKYWGKARKDGEEGVPYHLLPYHCLDVAAVAAAWWESSPVIRNLLCSHFPHIPELQVKVWLLFFISLHDMGKLHARFQLKALSAAKHCWPELDLSVCDSGKNYDHGLEGFITFIHGYADFLSLKKNDAYLDTWKGWVAAVTGHHGEIYESTNEPYVEYGEQWVIDHDREAQKGWFIFLEKLFLIPADLSLSMLPPPCQKVQQIAVAGFCSICDWIGSNEDNFAFKEDVSDLDNYFKVKKQFVLDNKLLEQAGLISQFKKFPGVEATVPQGKSPRGVQTIIDDLPLLSGMLLIEAPTGSGKTEASLAYAWRLLELGKADSIVFALPTQATANAMLDRIEQFANKLFPEADANVVLAHGKRDYHPTFIKLKEAARGNTVQGQHEALTQCAQWLSQSRKRVFLGQIGVCTIDQVLLSVLPIRHKFVRGMGLNKSVLVVDEVHAYSCYMYGLLNEVLKRQRLAGGSAVLLSATLPEQQRKTLLAAWQCQVDNLSNDYPLLTHATAAGVTPYTVVEVHRPESREVLTELKKLSDALPDEALYQKVIEAAESGVCVAIICNLVDNAQMIAAHLRERSAVPVDLFHARFRFQDRAEIEQEILKQYSPKREPLKGRILVSTQVIESSVDIDVDWMISQLCPIDLLFQRIGRLQRHQLERPAGFEDPLCTILTVDNGDYGTHKVIYQDPRVLWRTEKVISEQPDGKLHFPEVYRALLDRVYQEEPHPDEPSELDELYGKYYGEERALWRFAGQMIDMTRKQFKDEDGNVTALTRDGEMGISVLPLSSLAGQGVTLEGVAIGELEPWLRKECLDMNTLSVPKSWDKLLEGLDRDEEGRMLLGMESVGDGHWQAEVGGVQFKYSREIGMVREA